MTRCRRTAGFILVLATLALAAACHDGPTTAADPTGVLGAALTRETAPFFQTDALTYTLQSGSHGYTGEIGVQFTNRTGETVYFVNCNGITGMSLEKLIGGRWEVAWSPVVPQCLSSPIVVPPGGTYDIRISVFAGYPDSNMWPKFSVTDVTGVYRAVWHYALRSYQDDLPFGEQLALEQRVSNRFTLLLPNE
jgi:hypothetical protein